MKTTPTTGTEPFLDDILKSAERAGIAHNNGVDGQYILVCTASQLVKFATAPTPKPVALNDQNSPQVLLPMLIRWLHRIAQAEQDRDEEKLISRYIEMLNGFAAGAISSERKDGIRRNET